MSNLKLFRMKDGTAEEIGGSVVAKEKDLQDVIEKNLDVFLGVRFLESEFQTTGREHSGRIDTLGLDQNGCPVIIEYKKTENANVINQGLFYLDWLVTHRGDFEMVVKRKGVTTSVDWSGPRLICIASDFNKYDEHAVMQIDRNIQLFRYVSFEKDQLLLLEPFASAKPSKSTVVPGGGAEKTVSEEIDQADDKLLRLYKLLKENLEELGDDVQANELKRYVAFKRIKNFACVQVQKQRLLVYLSVAPDKVELKEGFTRDVSGVGHFGTGDLELKISSDAHIDEAKHLFELAYRSA